MAQEDKERWNKKYKNSPIPTKIVGVVEKYAQLATGKSALDIACGMGRNAKFLATEGFEVDALDISPVAIEGLQNIENIRAKEVDFDTYVLQENSYDLIVCTYFLERKLFPQIEKALKEDGIFIFETFMHHADNTKVPSNRSFLLEEGELEVTFDERYELLHISEFMEEGICGEKSMKASMVAKKRRGGMSDEEFWG
ncbi:MAG: methyltransferase domain-containing protein [Sulfurovaceae bacterium]|nr:methyltransferase domain-containing protein [Sulfurovaceae bacterium]